MIKLLFALALTLVLQPLSAQTVNTIPNPGFENWTDMGTYHEPLGWNTANQMFAPADTLPVSRTTDAHSGNYALLARTLQPGGFMFSGQVTAYEAVNTKPYALTGFFKYLPAGSDSCQIVIIMTRYNPGTGEQIIAGAGMFQSGGAASYQPFTAVINYDPAFFANVFPDSMRIYLVPGSGGQVPGSELYADDLSLQLSPTAVPEAMQQRLSIYPNPAQNQIRISLPDQNPSEPAVLTFTDMAGRVVREEHLPATAHGGNVLISIKDLKPGLYVVRLTQRNRQYVGQVVVLP